MRAGVAGACCRCGTCSTPWAPTEQRRTEEHLQPYAAALGATADGLRATLKRLWQLPWENCRKEPFWRLVYNAHPTAARLHLPDPCTCGTAPADRQHHFWACPIARAVLSAITASLPFQPSTSGAAADVPPDLPQRAIWLAQAPPAVHEGVWGVVCLAAVEAMDHGRRRMYAMRHTTAVLPPPTAIVATCSRSAVARFWCLLADFAALRRAPASWRTHCPPGHPFLSFDAAAGRFTVALPLAPLPALPLE